jgi:hypothetical protein
LTVRPAWIGSVALYPSGDVESADVLVVLPDVNTDTADAVADLTVL